MPLREIMIITQWRLEWPGRLRGAGGNGMGFTKVLWAGTGQGGLLGLRKPPTHPRHKLFPSCWMPSTARYTAEPLCLVAAGDKARADGRRVVVLAPRQWRGQPRSLSWPAEENAWVNTTPLFALWGSQTHTSATVLWTFNVCSFREGKAVRVCLVFGCLNLLLGGGRGGM